MIVPEITPLSRPYWEGARQHKLRLQFCLVCSHTWHPPAPACGACGQDDFEWRDASGIGQIHSFIVVREAIDPAQAERLPLVVALVRLAEGPLLICNILGCEPERIRVGASVEVAWERLTDEIVLPQFTLAPQSDA